MQEGVTALAQNLANESRCRRGTSFGREKVEQKHPQRLVNDSSRQGCGLGRNVRLLKIQENKTKPGNYFEIRI